MLYTEAELLSEMETLGKEIRDEVERKVLQDIGIGTPATRAAIIETLFTCHYIQRENKSLIPIEKGLQVYNLVKDKKVADVAMTAEWELILQKTRKYQSCAALPAHLLICPKCKCHPLVIRDKIVKCSYQDCDWKLFRNVCGLWLTVNDIESIVAYGRTSLIKGMKSKAGKRFDASIALNEDLTTSFVFRK